MRALALPVACALLLGLVFAGTVPPAVNVHRYAANPPLAHTGGFGEPTCRACHFGQPLNASGGSLAVTGLPDTYVPGKRYRLTLRLHRPDLGRGGFELTARFPDGTQAGSLRAADEGATVTTIDTSGVQYAHHTPAGTEPAAPDTARWTLEWTAPPSGGLVVIHAATNAANFDASAFGDFIYTAQRQSNASESGE